MAPNAALSTGWLVAKFTKDERLPVALNPSARRETHTPTSSLLLARLDYSTSARAGSRQTTKRAGKIISDAA